MADTGETGVEGDILSKSTGVARFLSSDRLANSRSGDGCASSPVSLSVMRFTDSCSDPVV